MGKRFTILLSLLFMVCFAKLDCVGQCSTPVTLSLNITPESCLGCCNGNIQPLVSGGCPPYSYTFTPTTSPNNFCSGSYTIAVRDALCCPMVTQTTTVGTPTSILEIENAKKISVSPNPSKGDFLFKSNSSETIYVFNGIGVPTVVV